MLRVRVGVANFCPNNSHDDELGFQGIQEESLVLMRILLACFEMRDEPLGLPRKHVTLPRDCSNILETLEVFQYTMILTVPTRKPHSRYIYDYE